ncbi:MBL fold metallo-hydrolase [Candidatus Woesearchaeota archaeon]|nr:MBL fold metallo-hydrolase [Candidatus Woesearchaeota archaeon]
MVKILDEVMKELPPDAKINDAVFEGANIVLYTKNKEFLLDNKGIIKGIVDNIKKRIELRADPSMVLEAEETKEKIIKILDDDKNKINIMFDSQRSRVIIESEKPGLAIGKGGDLLKEIKKETLWTPIVRRIPPMRSQLIENIRQVLYDYSDYRRKFLHKIGKRIYEGWTKDKRDEWVRLTCLGSAREVGRSCFLLQTPESKVLLDCGFNVAAPREYAFPYLDAPEFNIQELDAVILCHSHIDHCLPPDTLIEVEGGIIKPIDQIKEGDKLVTFNWNNGKKEIGKCIKKVKTYTHKEIIKVKTSYYNLEASPNHKFFVVENMEIKELEAGDLREGMMIPSIVTEEVPFNGISLFTDVDYRERIFLPKEAAIHFNYLRQKIGLSQRALAKTLNKNRNFAFNLERKNNYIYSDTLKSILKFYNIPENEFYNKFNVNKTNLPKFLNPKLAQCLGYIAGDGHQATENSLRLTDESRVCLEFYSDLISEVFNYKPEVVHYTDNSKNAFVAEICNAAITRYVNMNFKDILNYSKYRVMPINIILSSPDIIKGFIRGFADADGCVKKEQIAIDTTSQKMSEQIQFMLNRLGIESSLSIENRTGYSEFTSYRLNIKGRESVLKFSDLIGFGHLDKKNKLDKLLLNIKDLQPKNKDFIPLSTDDVHKIIKSIGLGNECSDLILNKDLPKNVFSIYKGSTSGLTRYTADSLYEFLLNRQKVVQKSLLSNNIKQKRLIAGLSKNSLANLINLTINDITKLESGKNFEFCNLVNENLNKLIINIRNNILDKLTKLKFFMCAEVKWQKITSIKKEKNEYEYLVDLKVTDNSNFVANGVVVHNCGTVPFLYKMGFRGPTYATAPCRDVTALMCLDLIEIAQKEGNDPPYTVNDVKEFVKHSVCLDYEEVSDVTPDMRLTLYNAGHTLGSAIAHVHIGNGLHNFLYTSDFNYETSNLLGPAATRYPRIESVMMESTYGTRSDTSPSRKESEEELIKEINETAAEHGKILMPVLGVGRSQEIMLILERAMREKRIPDMPVYVQGMLWDVTAIHTAYPDYLSPRVKRELFQYDHNPFLSPIFKRIKSQKEMQEVKDSKGPFIVMATSGMLQGGPALEYFKHFAENPKNCLIFTCYQGIGSIGRRIEEGEREIAFVSGGSKRPEVTKILMKIYTIKGFSGHSSFKQLVSWVGSLEPLADILHLNN